MAECRARDGSVDGGSDSSETFLEDGVLKPPLAEDALVEMKPMLLGANHHSGPLEAHESDEFGG